MASTNTREFMVVFAALAWGSYFTIVGLRALDNYGRLKRDHCLFEKYGDLDVTYISSGPYRKMVDKTPRIYRCDGGEILEVKP